MLIMYNLLDFGPYKIDAVCKSSLNKATNIEQKVSRLIQR
jgi:hypothetical protein